MKKFLFFLLINTPFLLNTAIKADTPQLFALFDIREENNVDSILNCSMFDKTQNSVPVSQVTRTKTGSMLGRAALGALTFGVAGAVVGAVTAKKESISAVTPTHSGSYIVNIGIKSLEKPVLTLEFGSDKIKAEEVYALVQAIIAMK